MQNPISKYITNPAACRRSQTKKNSDICVWNKCVYVTDLRQPAVFKSLRYSFFPLQRNGI